MDGKIQNCVIKINLMKVLIISMSFFLMAFLSLISCNKNNMEMQKEMEVQNNTPSTVIEYQALPVRPGTRPETTPNIPHMQINLDIVQEVHEEMVRRIYSIPGVEEQPSIILSWQGLWIEDHLTLAEPGALLGGREFGHIHDDGSLHIFLEPKRAKEAIAAGWAVLHPFAAKGRKGWDGFVMLYTPQSIEELNTTFQLIVEAYNYVTGQAFVATDFYDG